MLRYQLCISFLAADSDVESLSGLVGDTESREVPYENGHVYFDGEESQSGLAEEAPKEPVTKKRARFTEDVEMGEMGEMGEETPVRKMTKSKK